MLRLPRLIAAFFALSLLAPFAAPARSETRIEAGSCAIANSGSANGNTVTCNFDMPPEKLKELMAAALKGSEDPILDRLVQISKMRIPMKPARHSKRKPATDSDLKPAGIPI
jgi:hypothetical protein